MARQIINTNQAKKKQMFTFPGNKRIGQHDILFDKDLGYYFSDDAIMDDIVEYFIKQPGFKQIGVKKGSVSSKIDEDLKESKTIFKKK